MSIISELRSASSITDKYKTANYRFPAYEKIDPKLKTQPEYCLKVVRAGFSSLMRDKTALPCNYYNYIQKLRDYGTGNQDRQYYLNKIKEINVTGSTQTSDLGNTKRKGLSGLNDKIVSIATNLKNAIHGMLENYEEDIYVNAIDNESGVEEEKAMIEALFDIEKQSFTKRLEDQYKLPLTTPQEFPEGTSLEELELYRELGGFKTFWAESMEELIKYIEKTSKWDRVLKRKFIDDAIDLNFIAARNYYDSSSGEEKWGYIDIANFCIQYSEDNFFNDSEYGGVFTLEKISTLIELGFDSDKLIAAAKHYGGLFDNPNVTWKKHDLNNEVFSFKIPVFHFSWIDVDVKNEFKLTNEFKKTFIHELKFGESLRPLSDYKKKKGIEQEPMITRVKKCYQCSWVVDTDMIYEYGAKPNQAKAELPFFAWKGITTNKNMMFGSITESIIPFLDQLHMGWLKYQDALAKSHPGGYAFNIRLLQNLQMGGKKIDPLDAYKMFWDTGRFPYMDTPIGENYKGGAVLPITKIEGNTGELLAVFEREIQFIIAMIEKLTGITAVAMGATPDANTAVSIQKMASVGTNNVIRPLINGIFELKELLADRTAKDVPLLLRNIPKVRKAYSKIIGKKSVEVILKAEKKSVEYGMYMEARPDDESKKRLIDMVEVALQRGRDGEASIDIAQASYILERIENGGNHKKLQKQIGFMIEKAKEEAFKQKRAIIAEQSQQQTAQKQAEQQGKMQEKQIDFQMEKELKDIDFQNELRLKQAEANVNYKQKLIDKKLELQKEKT